MDQVLASWDVPELEGIGIRRRVVVRVELDHAIVIGEPRRMCVARIQGGIFQQAQAPTMRRIWSAAAVQPVAPVVRVSAQVLPGQRGAALVQNVEISRCRIPVFDAAISHDGTSLCLGCVAWIPSCGSYRITIRLSSKSG